MLIEVRVFATLRQQLTLAHEDGKFKLDIVNGTTPEQLLNICGLRAAEAQVILVNGLVADRSAPLQEGDVVSIFPMVGGGA